MRSLRIVVAGAVILACGSSSSPGSGGTAAPGNGTDAGSIDAGGSGGSGADAGSGSSADAGSGGNADAGSTTPDAGNPGGGSGSDAGTGAGDGGTADGGTAVLVPERLTVGEGALALALDGENVYWATYKDGTGWRDWHYRISGMSKSGSVPLRIAEGAGAMIRWLVARDGFVSWSMATCPVSCDTAEFRTHLYRRAFSGPIWQYDVDTSLDEIAVDAGRLYYRARWSPGQGGLWSIRLDGLDNRQLTTHDAGTGPALDSGTLFYFDTGGNPDDGFWSALRTIPAAGGTVNDLRTETNTLIWPRFISVGVDSVFMNSSTTQGFWRAPLDGSKWQMTWGGQSIGAPDVHGGKVYFPQTAYDSFDGCIVRANPNGSDATCIDKGKHSYAGVKVDDAKVYFIRDGDIWRLPRR